MKRAILPLVLIVSLAGSAGVSAGTIEYVAHACFVIESEAGERILIDPYASKVWLGYERPEVPDIDAVVVTHPHYDHDAGRYRGEPWPWDESVRVLDSPGQSRVGSIEVLGVKGKHADPYGMEFGQLNTIFRIEVDGLAIVHVGDNGPLTEENYAALRPVDILMVPADGLEHILKNSEITAMVAALAPRVLIPMHYRIPELEIEPDSPGDLGEIEPWLEEWGDILRLGSHRWSPRLPNDAERDEPMVVLFDASPRVPRPQAIANR